MRKKKIYAVFASTFLILIILAVLDFYGIIWHNEIFAQMYSVKGLDVSHYQNTVVWDGVSKKYRFVFIKATEGKDYVDPTFLNNWSAAKENGFLVGAYHFFVTSSSGEKQASNFIKTVPVEENSLPPVIDIEISKNKDKLKVRENLTIMIDMLTKNYGSAPILYVTYDTYNAFIKGYYEQCNIWIRDIIKPPKLSDSREWTFWQYNNRGRIRGIDTYVDINVFHGSNQQLLELIDNSSND
jgi:lysozyme